MRPINRAFLNDIILKYSTEECIIHITDTASKILASTDSERVGDISSTAIYINKVQRATSMANLDQTKERFSSVYGVPLYADDELYGTVIVRGQAKTASEIGEKIKTAIETIIAYEKYTNADADHKDRIESIAMRIINGEADREGLYSDMYKLDMDPELLRCVIYIKLSYRQNNYFNIKLNLGYSSGIEQFKSRFIEKLSANLYFNSQDIVFMYDYDTALIIKSFIPGPDLSRIYRSLDRICESVAVDCSDFKSAGFKIACGSIYASLDDVPKSFREAEELINIGLRSKKDTDIFLPENMLFESLSYYMNSQIKNKIILSTISSLTKKDGHMASDIIDCAEAYVDSCMNVTETAKITGLHRNTINSRLDKLRQMTGLDPSKSFKDAFIIKETAVYIRQNTEDS